MPRERPIPLKADEHDMLTSWRKVDPSDKGRSASAKRQYRKRLRRKQRQEDRRTDNGLPEGWR